jgi:mono/diheme cytochrome c family protein
MRHPLRSCAQHRRCIVLVASRSLLTHELPGDPASRRKYTNEWCSDCHNPKDTADNSGLALDFTSIVKRPATTALALRVFFQTNHDRMPDFILEPAEADDIIAYLLSLKPK